MKPELIAIVDDEPDIVELVSIHLKKNNFDVKSFFNGQDFIEYLKLHRPSLVILDLMLPDIDGLQICTSMKSNGESKHIPIIMLTAKGDETDKIVGLELGADDYVTKPFSPKELVARVKAILRRGQPEEVKKDSIEIAGRLVIDGRRFEVYVDGKQVVLTTTEFRILTMLAERQGWVFSREQLLTYLWGNEKAVLDRTIDVHIKHLREKLGDAGDLVKNIRGIGYKLDIE